jgi:hypothetical protein
MMPCKIVKVSANGSVFPRYYNMSQQGIFLGRSSHMLTAHASRTALSSNDRAGTVTACVSVCDGESFGGGGLGCDGSANS